DELHIIRNDLPGQRDAADVPGLAAQALTGLLDGGERLREQVVERVLPALEPGPELPGLPAQGLVGEPFELGEQAVNLVHERPGAAHFALVLGPEDGFEKV